MKRDTFERIGFVLVAAALFFAGRLCGVALAACGGVGCVDLACAKVFTDCESYTFLDGTPTTNARRVQVYEGEENELWDTGTGESIYVYVRESCITMCNTLGLNQAEAMGCGGDILESYGDERYTCQQP